MGDQGSLADLVNDGRRQCRAACNRVACRAWHSGPHFPRGPRRPTARTAGNPRIVAFSAPRSKAIPYANVLERCDALARSTDQGGLQAQNRSLGNRCSLLDTVHPFRERHSPEALVGAANCLGAVVAVETTHTETADCCRQLFAL